MSATYEPTISKTHAPAPALRDQAATGVYFEYTFGMSKVDDDKGRVLFRNVALFAAGDQLLMKRSTAEVSAPFSAPATIKTTEAQSSFRAATEPLTPEQAFMTVMHAWQYATQRPTLSHMKVASRSGTPDVITIGAYAVATEPLLFPVATAELAALKDTQAAKRTNAARKLARAAELMWQEAAKATPHPDTAKTPAFRIPGGLDNEQLRTDTLLGEFAQNLLSDPATEHPEYVALTGVHAAGLPDTLRNIAIGASTFKAS